MKLEGHHGEVWALAVAKNGSFIVSGSHDRSLRIWEKTDEQVTRNGNGKRRPVLTAIFLLLCIAFLGRRTGKGAGTSIRINSG
jgi:WD40 repeat protein